MWNPIQINRFSSRFVSKTFLCVLVLLLVACSSGSTTIVTQNCQASNGSICQQKANASNSSSTTNVSSGTTSSLPSPTPTPTPTPTPEPKKGDTLYQANWSSGMNGWIGSNDWHVVSGMLVNDGTQYETDGNPTIIAPYLPSSADYAVIADIQLVRYSDEGSISGLDDFGIVVRSPEGGGGYSFIVCASAGFQSCGKNDDEVLLSDGNAAPIDEMQYHPQSKWHTYRIEVKGDTITVLIDGGTVFQDTDNKYLDAGRIGLWSNDSQISIRSFKVIML